MVKLFSKFLTEISQSTKELTFRRLPGKAGQTLQKKPVPRNPNTQAQKARREAFSRLCYLWSADKIKDKQCYIDIAKKLNLDKTNFYLKSLLDILTYEPAICFRFSQPAGSLIDLTGLAQSAITAQQYSTVELQNKKRVCQGNGTSDHIYIRTTNEINWIDRYNSTYFVAFCPLSIPTQYAVIWKEGWGYGGANINYDDKQAAFEIYSNSPNGMWEKRVKIADLKLNEFIVAAIRFDNENKEIVAFTTTEQNATTWTPPLYAEANSNALLSNYLSIKINGTTYLTANGDYFYANAQLAHFSINNIAFSDQKIYRILKDIERLVGQR